ADDLDFLRRWCPRGGGRHGAGRDQADPESSRLHARMITPVRGFRFVLAAIIGAVATASASAHDSERTNVKLTFARDGSFILDVANDPDWLLLRLEPFETTGLKTRTTTGSVVVPALRPAID